MITGSSNKGLTLLRILQRYVLSVVYTPHYAVCNLTSHCLMSLLYASALLAGLGLEIWLNCGLELERVAGIGLTAVTR